MVLSGLFDRFPKLKIFWAENNISWIPGFLEQMDINYERNKFWAERLQGLKPLARRPSEYVREHAYWGFFDDPIGVTLRNHVGIDHILWGGDFPHEPSHWPNSMEYMEKQLDGVPEDEKRKLMCDNTINFFHLDM
jgi:predicted TIM-barrel fold metal-dependent hydrolase